MAVLERVMSLLGYVKAEAMPKPSQLYPASFGIGIPTMGPISFPGWDKWQSPTETDKARAQKALRSAWVYSDVSAIAQELSAADPIVYEKAEDEEEQVKDHPFLTLWNRPNPWMSNSFVEQFWCWQLCFFGEAYLWFVPGRGNGSAGEIWPIPSTMIEPYGDGQEFIAGYHWRARAGDQPKVIESKYICYSNLPHLFDPRRGMSPLVAAYAAVELDLAQADWNRNFFGKRNAIPTGIISVPEDTPPADFERVRAELYDFYGGGKREVAITRAGTLDVKLLGITQKDMDFLAGRAFSRDEIDRIFGIPGGFWAANATEANARHAKAIMIEQAVWPKLVMLSQDLNSQHMREWWGEQYRIAFTDIRPRNVELDIRLADSRKGYWTIEELRAEDGKPPLGDPRDNLIAIELAAKAKSGELISSGSAPQNLQDIHQKALPAGISEAMRNDLLKWERKSQGRIKAGKSATCSFDSEAIPEVLKAFVTARLNEGTEDAFAFLKAAPEGRAAAEEKLRKQINAVLANHWGTTVEAINNGHDPDLAPLREALAVVLNRQIPHMTEDEIARQIVEVGIDFEIPGINLAASQWARSYVPDLLDDLTDTTKDVIRAGVSRFIETPGMTIGELKEALVAAFGENRAQTIAVTETTRAYSQGTQIMQSLLADAGIKMAKVWGTSGDALVCELCIPLNGKKQTEWPDDAGDGPPRHTRCRCLLTLSRVT